MHLVRLCYVSVRQDRGAGDVADILRESRDWNKRRGLTGVLIVTDHEYAQVLEGHRSEVAWCMARIMHDTRHREIQLVSMGDAPSRWFPGWTMQMFGGPVRDEDLSPNLSDGGPLKLASQTQSTIEKIFKRLSDASNGQGF